MKRTLATILGLAAVLAVAGVRAADIPQVDGETRSRLSRSFVGKDGGTSTGLTNTGGFFLGGTGTIGTNGSASTLTVNMATTFNGSLTAPNASSTAASALANVAALDARYDARYRHHWVFHAANLLPKYSSTSVTLGNPSLNMSTPLDIPHSQLGTNKAVSGTGVLIGYFDGLSPAATSIVSRIIYTTRAGFIDNPGDYSIYYVQLYSIGTVSNYAAQLLNLRSETLISTASNVLNQADSTNSSSMVLTFTNSFQAQTNAERFVGFCLYRQGSTNTQHVTIMHSRAE